MLIYQPTEYSFDLRSKASITSVSFGDVNHTMLNFDNRLQNADHYNFIIKIIVLGGQFNNKPPSASDFVHNYIVTVCLLQTLLIDILLKWSVVKTSHLKPNNWNLF
jgi:hypothetical protein